MLISTGQLEQGAVGFRQSLPPGAVNFEGYLLRQAGPLHLTGQAELIAGSDGEIRVAGNLEVELEAECGRCLAPFRHKVAAPFSLTYAPVAQLRGAEEVEIDEAGADVGFYEGPGIVLEDVAREQILLALPFQLLCREDCKGLCPQCGKDRNLESCACAELGTDPRWSGLRDLRL